MNVLFFSFSFFFVSFFFSAATSRPTVHAGTAMPSFFFIAGCFFRSLLSCYRVFFYRVFFFFEMEPGAAAAARDSPTAPRDSIDSSSSLAADSAASPKRTFAIGWRGFRFFFVFLFFLLNAEGQVPSLRCARAVCAKKKPKRERPTTTTKKQTKINKKSVFFFSFSFSLLSFFFYRVPGFSVSLRWPFFFEVHGNMETFYFSL